LSKEKKRSKKKERLARGVGLSHGMAYGHPERDSSRHHQHQRPTAADTRQPVGRQCKRARVLFIDGVVISSNPLAPLCVDTELFGRVVFPLPQHNEKTSINRNKSTISPR